MKLAVLPARGGSKRIPRKNIKEFCGKPMIAWALEEARRSGCFDRIIVSTDDAEIAEVACRWGAEAPFMRPPELSGDHVGSTPVIVHAIDWQMRHGEKPSAICCVYPTAPFLRGEDVRRGLDLLTASGCDYVFPVARYGFPVQRAVRITDVGRVEMFQPEYFHTRSQDLEDAYHDAGQFYWGQTQAWLEEKPIFSSNTAPIILPRWRVQDIDTPEDWRQAEMLFRLMRSERV